MVKFLELFRLVLSFGGGTAWNFSMDQSSRTRRQWNRNQPFSNKKGCGIKNRSGEKYIPQNVDRLGEIDIFEKVKRSIQVMWQSYFGKGL